jgi:hypothetical protein
MFDRFFSAGHDRSLKVAICDPKASNSRSRGASALAALVQGFRGAETIAFAAEFAFRGGGAGALLAGARLGFRQFLASAGEAGFKD